MSKYGYVVGDNEAERLSILKEMGILDTVEEKAFDEITEMTALIFDVPAVLISLLDETRQWFKSHYGLAACQTDRKVAFCNYTVMYNQIFEVLDPQNDERFTNNPLVTGDLHLRYYCGAPIVVKGEAIGSLCLLGFTEHAPLTEDQRKILTGMANIVATNILNKHLILKSTELFSQLIRDN